MPNGTPSIGDNLARIRRRRGLTQEQLAERAGVSVSVIRKLERGDRESAALPTLHKLADGLAVTTVELFAPLATRKPRIHSDLYEIRQALQPARSIAGVRPSLADGEEDPTLDNLRAAVDEVSVMFRDCAYAGAVAALPTVLAQGFRTVAALDGDARAAAWVQLSVAYQTAGMVLIQVHRDDLAYQAIGLAMDAGRNAGDTVLVAAAVCTENWLLIRQSRFDEAEHTALQSAEQIEPSLSRSPARQVAVFGWLNLGAAAAAARDNRPDRAADALRRARAAANMAAPDRQPDTAHWTTLTPPVVAIREVELAMVAGDAERALRAASSVPDGTKPAVTYRRFRLDVAAALLEQRRADEALHILLDLYATVPGWLRYQRYAQVLVDRLLHRSPRTLPDELRILADFLDLGG